MLDEPDPVPMPTYVWRRLDGDDPNEAGCYDQTTVVSFRKRPSLAADVSGEACSESTMIIEGGVKILRVG